MALPDTIGPDDTERARRRARQAWAERINGWHEAGLGRGAVIVHGIIESDGRYYCTCTPGGTCWADAPGKHPVKRDWTSGEAANAFSIGARNVGTRTGDGLLIVDLDGVQGRSSWRALVTEVGEDVPTTVAVRTGSGGYQAYFRVRPEQPGADLLRSMSHLRPGLDLRWTGGQGVGPGSLHETGAEYTLQRDTPDGLPAEIPDRLLEAMVAPLAEKERERLDAPRASGVDVGPATLAEMDSIAQTIRETDALPEGERTAKGHGWHDVALGTTARLAQLVKGGHIGEGEACAFLDSLPALDGTLVAFRGAMERADIRADDPRPVIEEVPAEWWDSTPTLARIRDAAWSRGVGPWGVLVEVLARVTASTPPTRRTPERNGDGGGSLNLLVVTVAPPGVGKGETAKCARDLFGRPPTPLGDVLSVDSDFTHPAGESLSIGTGEGLVSEFVRWEGTGADRELRQYRTRALLTSTEVSEVKAKGADRLGTTLLSYLRQAIVGERIGQSTADKERSKAIPEQAARVCLVIHAQPESVDWILDDAGKGLPQRVLWAAILSDLPTDDEERDWPGVLDWKPLADPHGVKPMGCDPEIIRWLADVHLAKTRRLAGKDLGRVAHLAEDPYVTDPLLAHAPFIRVKIASAIALLHSRSTIAPQDWEASEVIMRHSLGTRLRLEALRQEVERRVVEAQGRRDAVREGAKVDSLSARERVEIEAARERITTILGKADDRTMLRGALLRAVGKSGSPARRRFVEALGELAEGEIVEINKVQNGASQSESVRLTGS